jgi:hypothetical protein
MSPAPFITRKKDVQPLGGDWAAKLRAVGSVLDGHNATFRELCVIEVDDGFVVQAFERRGTSSEWVPASLEIRTGDVASESQSKPAR